MFRCSLCLVVLVSLLGIISAWRIRPSLSKCSVVQRQCDLECGRSTCTVKQKCCIKGTKICSHKTTVETVCKPFQCLNGGTRMFLRGKRATSVSTSGCEVPAPVCRCPAGFSGTCCQVKEKEGTCPIFGEKALLPCGNDTCKTDADCQGQRKCCDRYCSRVCVNPRPPVDPCTLVKCSKGTVCRTVPVFCFRAPCPSMTRCVPIEKEGVCPAFLEIARLPCGNDECKIDADCQGQQKCCDRYCSRVCVDPRPADPCESVKCSTGEECRTVSVICKKPPCPPITTCVPIKKPGTCPGFLEIARLPCGNDTCKTDADCQGQQKCCDKYCSRHCAHPEIGSCGFIDCPKGTVCKQLPGLCKVPPCCTRPTCVQRNKPGTCPALRNAETPCHYNCTDDSDCLGREKCCNRGCSRDCAEPENPCALVDCGPNKTCITAVSPCLIQPCPVRAKCVPTLERPGICPAFVGPVTDCRFRIRRSCQNDNECPLNHKCCNRGCEKKECYSVRPDILNPCIATTCPINSRCIVGPDRRPTCIPILFPSDPCIAATCLINQRCIARNGKPRCIPLLKSTDGPTPYASGG